MNLRDVRLNTKLIISSGINILFMVILCILAELKLPILITGVCGALFLILGIFAAYNIRKSVMKEVNTMSNALEALANGDLNIKVQASRDEDLGKMAVSLNKLTGVISGVSSQLAEETLAIKDGRVDEKIDVKNFQGCWRQIIRNVNDINDTYLAPLKKMDEYLELMSKGNIPSKITDEYRGGFNRVKDSLNGIIDTLNLFIEQINWMYTTLQAGNTRDKIDLNKFNGSYKQMANAVNDIVWLNIEKFINIFEILKAYSEGDFSAQMEKLPGRYGLINEHLENLRSTLIRVNGDVINLINAADQGKLSIRGDEEKYTGDFKKIIQGINKTFDAFEAPIKEISYGLAQMKEGKLNFTIKGDYKGEYGEIIDSLNASIEAFNEVLGEINTSSEQVAAGAAQVSSSSQELSQGSTEQASAIEEITSSMTEISSQTKENAVSADEANNLAVSAKKGAEQGKSQMTEMLKAMDEINESSASISKIIKVIDEIAFQTNILALNAAVEAARAGQHGKGFAVVAEEVRNLAARSANAAKETTTMIEESIRKSEKGKAIADETAEELNTIVDHIEKVAQIISEIASASNEQATAITQINEAIEHVSKVTQMNTATSEESASASEELSSQAVGLKEMVGRFSLKRRSFANSIVRNNEAAYSLSDEAYKKDAYNQERSSNKSKIKISLDDREFGKY
ncbi:MAG: methyl-accepting chemotaxis protein [Bacillota bacterium]|nr:methyl-accepting chemotaxis protein [Bacillota bacterium]